MFLHEAGEHSAGWLSGWHFEPALVSALGMLILLPVAWAVDPAAVAAVVAALIATSPFWLPVALFISFWKIWIHYIRYQSWFKTPMVLLHVELPPEVTKSPKAMELFLSAVHNTGGMGTFIHRIWRGSMVGITTLELVGNGGRISFYIHVRAFWRETVEARLYGQFPEARISTVDDYVDRVPFSNDTHGMWGAEYKKSSAAPISTYIDWELNLQPDTPETKVEPLTHIFELLGTTKPDEHLWIQIVLRPRRGDEWYGFPIAGGTERFVAELKKKIEEITKGAIARAQTFVNDDAEKKKVGARGSTLLTEGERFAVSAIERQMGKQVFDTGIRALYIANRATFDGSRIGNLVTLWAPFRGVSTLNVTRGMAIFDYFWQDWNNIRADRVKEKMFFWYKHRAYFYVPYDQVPNLMTTEEIASIWHFPNSAVKTPALQRVPSSRAEAPANLPI